MKKNVVKFLSALVLSVLISSPVFAEDAVVTFVKGKVEVQRGNAWVQLNVGDKIKQSDTVSTGFQSEAKIKYSGSLMALGALTRITMDELASGGNKEKVDVYLTTGTVRSKVTHDEDTRVSYTVRSPVAVASVRGTEFDMQAKGTVRCFEGAVAVYPNTKPRDSASTESASEAEEESGSEDSGDNGPADSTTPAGEINNDADDGAVVVGANQKTTFSKSGTPEKPQDNAKKDANKVKSTVSTAASKEAVSTSGTSTESASEAPDAPAAPAAPKTGGIDVTITFNDAE